MKLYQHDHSFYCGIDLHANKMYACVVDSNGKKRLHQNFHTRDTLTFTQTIEPFCSTERSLVIGCESTFNWYWLCDWCRGNKLRPGTGMYYLTQKAMKMLSRQLQTIEHFEPRLRWSV